MATYLTKWGKREDRKLLKMMQYLKSMSGDKQVGFIGDPLEELELQLFADADFCGRQAGLQEYFRCVLVALGS